MNTTHPLIKAATLVGCLLLLTGCDQLRRIGDLPLGVGHTVHEMCSRVFVSGQDPDLIIEDVLVQKVFPLQWVWNIDIDRNEKTVSVGAPFFNSWNNATAVYREGLGCTLTYGKAPAELRASGVEPVEPGFEVPDDQHWPDGSLGVAPDLSDYDMAAIDGIVDSMFEEFSEDRYEQINTYAVLVIHDGQLIAERYSPEHSQDNRMLGWSMSKTVTALLLGILEQQGKVALDDEVALESEPASPVTVQHVLNMASGLGFNEDYEGTSDVSLMLYQQPNASAYVKSLPVVHEPGTHFNYSTGDTQLLSDIVQQAAGGTTQAAYEFYQQSLFHKLSIESAEVEHDASGTFIGGARMFMRPRDWAKIGQLMLNEGRWNGEQVVAKEWIDTLLTPSPAADYYGGQIWLYEPETFGEDFPKDAYTLWGVLGQFTVVVPSKDLVVVRMGANGSGLPESVVRPTVFDPALEIINSLP
ncbi:MAG: serine hydrolase domain-containing protein [Pseudomonadota bacterium]